MRTILIIENEPGSRFILDATLRAADYDCIAAETLADAQSLIQRGGISLVITDLHIGADADGLAGLTLIQWMRNDPDAAGLPVIVASAERSEEAQRAALEAGARSYLLKPYENRTLLAHIARCFDD